MNSFFPIWRGVRKSQASIMAGNFFYVLYFSLSLSFPASTCHTPIPSVWLSYTVESSNQVCQVHCWNWRSKWICRHCAWYIRRAYLRIAVLLNLYPIEPHRCQTFCLAFSLMNNAWGTLLLISLIFTPLLPPNTTTMFLSFIMC